MNCLDCKTPFQKNQPMMQVRGGYICESCMVDRRHLIVNVYPTELRVETPGPPKDNE